jgi:DNA repair photolyase
MKGPFMPNVKVTTAISRSSLPGLDYTFNPYVGCIHGCIYCYARCFTRDREVVENWGKAVKLKARVLELLENQITKIKRGIVGISTITDPYQPIEKRAEVSRKAIQILVGRKFYISIQTKSDLVLRDIDIIRGRDSDVGVTITTFDTDLAKKLEPGASLPEARASVIESFSEKGIKTWIFYGPIIPKLNDDLETVLKIAKLAKKTESEVIIDRLRLRPRVIRSLKDGLKEEAKEIIKLAGNRAYGKALLSNAYKTLKGEGVNVSYAFQERVLDDFLS